MRSATAEFIVDLNQDHYPTVIEFHSKGSTSISPLKYEVRNDSDLSSPIHADMQFEKLDPINFYVDIYTDSDEQSRATFEVYCPSHQILEWTQNLLLNRWPNSISDWYSNSGDDNTPEDWMTHKDIIDEIRMELDSNNLVSKMSEFENKATRWLSFWEKLYLSNQLSTHIDGYAYFENKKDLKDQLAIELKQQSDSSHFEIQNWNEIVQITDTTRLLPNIPKISPEELIKYTIKSLLNFENKRSDPAEIAWHLEKKYDISTHSIEKLDKNHINVLLAKAATERDYQRAEKLIKGLNPKNEVDKQLSSQISKAESSRGKESIKRRRDLLLPTLKSDKTLFLENLANYLDNLTREREYSLQSSIAINGAKSSIYNELSRSNFERTASFYHNYGKGIRFLNLERYEDALEAFNKSISKSLEEFSTHGDIRFTQLDSAFVYYCRTKFQYLQENKNFSQSTQWIENKALPLVEQFEYFKENKPIKKRVRKQLDVLSLEAKGDLHLYNQEIKQAASNFGEAVGILHKLDKEGKAGYLQNKRRSLEAAIKEQEGDFIDAAESHESIVENIDEKDDFGQFHSSRAKICRAKKDIINENLESARNKISEVDISWGVVGTEMEYIDLLLKELNKYNSGKSSEINDVLYKLDNIEGESSQDLYIDYGHNYRQIFINVLVAQKLKQIKPENSISDVLIELSLSETLKPQQVEYVMKRSGFSDIEVKNQWMKRVPIFILKEFREVENSEASKSSVNNYKEIGEKITGVLEQHLALIVRYYIKKNSENKKFSKFFSKDEDPSLSTLRDLIKNSMFDDLSWKESVVKILQRVEHEDIVMPSKDGDIIDVRNDLDHGGINKLTEDDYMSIKSDVETILQDSAVEMPVIGKVLGENEYGAYTIHLFRSGTKNEIEIMTTKRLENEKIYYFPPKVLEEGSVCNIDSGKIVICESNSVREGLIDFGTVDIID